MENKLSITNNDPKHPALESSKRETSEEDEVCLPQIPLLTFRGLFSPTEKSHVHCTGTGQPRVEWGKKRMKKMKSKICTKCWKQMPRIKSEKQSDGLGFCNDFFILRGRILSPSHIISVA